MALGIALAFFRADPRSGTSRALSLALALTGCSIFARLGVIGAEGTPAVDNWARLNVLLGIGGFKKQIAGFNVERLGNSARSLALGRYAFNLARDHAAVRKQFGRHLCEFQGLQWKFADMALKLESAQMLLYRAANVREELPSPYQTAIAKLALSLIHI